MPTPSTRIIWRQSDGHFNVVAEPRSGRATFRVRAWFKGHRPTEESAKTRQDALTAAQSIWSAYQKGFFENSDSDPKTLGELIERLENRDETELSPATFRTYLQAIGYFAAKVGAWRSLSGIGERDLRLWLHAQTCSEVSKASYLRSVRAVFGWALSKGWLKKNPARGIKLRYRQRIRPWLNHADWPAFLAACSPCHRIRAMFVMETGLRSKEVRFARWDWLHGIIGRKAIRIADDPDTGFTPKGGQPRAVPLTERAMVALELARQRWGSSGFVFSDRGLRSANFARENRLACDRAELTHVDFQGLRRTAGARWLELGIALHDVSRLLGHRDITTTMRWYAGISDAHLARCIEVVDAANEPAQEGKIVTLPSWRRRR